MFGDRNANTTNGCTDAETNSCTTYEPYHGKTAMEGFRSWHPESGTEKGGDTMRVNLVADTSRFLIRESELRGDNAEAQNKL